MISKDKNGVKIGQDGAKDIRKLFKLRIPDHNNSVTCDKRNI